MALPAHMAWSAASGQPIITTVAGSGGFGTSGSGFSGDGGPATSALMNSPYGVAVDFAGNVFIADTGNNRIRKVSAIGIMTTVAGTGKPGFSGDGGPATSASLAAPIAVAVDSFGNLFIADASNNRIRKVSASGIITTVVGDGFSGFSGDGGAATSASLDPYGIAVDFSGNLYIADTVNNRIMKVSTSGIITTVAGNGSLGFSGDGGPATSATMNIPSGIAVDSSGNLFIVDSNNNRIRKVSTSGTITTVAGNGSLGFSGDGGTATLASFYYPSSIAVDSSGNLYIADGWNNRIRKVSTNGLIATVAGSGYAGPGGAGFSGDDGPPTSATLSQPFGVAMDASGNLFIADTTNNRIREVQTVSALSGIQNAANYATTAVSPGEIVILYGAEMGPTALTGLQVDSASGLLKTTVGGTTVLFNGIPAPIVYTSAGQISVIVPYEIASTGTADILVNYQGNNVAAGTVAVASSAPGIFTVNSGTGQAAALNQDGSVNSVSNPAAAGSTIVLYLTGEGQTTPSGVDGKIASVTPYPAPVLPVTVTIGGQTAMDAYAGAAPGEVAGVMQINATIPTGVTGNAVPVSVQVGTVSTQSGVTIAVQ